MGYAHSYIARICKSITRPKSIAAQLRQPPQSKHWRSSRQAARKKMERHLGRKLKRSEHVHHKDGDFTNNLLANLEVLDARAHARHHHPKNPIPRHLRPERKEYMKRYLKEYLKTYRKDNGNAKT